ncbi:MAG: PDZ domain-containing protein [Lachnospiraceae bacterium]|nr:PDZ domain-containing protein [Lachnospiraceae bacterium]
MPDTEQNKQSDFIMEKIKERPLNKKKLLRKTLITVCMAVIFGLIACLTFLILEPVFSNWLYPEEEPPLVILPEESDEMAPEDMLVEDEDESSIQEVVESVILEDEQLQKILENLQLDKTHYEQFYSAMDAYVKELEASMVVVTVMTSDVDWLNNTYESEGRTSGVIIATNGSEYLILTDSATVRGTESILVTFIDGTGAEAELRQWDRQTGLAVVAVQIDGLPESTRDKVKIADLGSSNMRDPVGVPVVALGAPMGTVGSAGYGMLVSAGSIWSKVDATYKLLTTDIYGSQQATGVLFNMRSQIIGIIIPGGGGTDRRNAVTAIGISELRKLIENMSNGKELAYLGVSGVDVTAAANKEMGVPYGAYVREVAMDSPAMLAGIQRGDIIVELDGSSIENFTNYTTTLQRLEAGQTVTIVVQRLSQNSYREMSMEITLGAAN